VPGCFVNFIILEQTRIFKEEYYKGLKKNQFQSSSLEAFSANIKIYHLINQFCAYIRNFKS